jgi:hypothetical protein
MVVNPKVDSWGKLIELPGLKVSSQTAWKFRLIQIRRQSLALSAVAQWAAEYPEDFDSIMMRLRLVGSSRRPPLAPWVRKVSERDVYAIPASSEVRGLLYFYDRRRDFAISTNAFDSADPGDAVTIAETIQQLYFSNSIPFHSQ